MMQMHPGAAGGHSQAPHQQVGMSMAMHAAAAYPPQAHPMGGMQSYPGPPHGHHGHPHGQPHPSSHPSYSMQQQQMQQQQQGKKGGKKGGKKQQQPPPHQQPPGPGGPQGGTLTSTMAGMNNYSQMRLN